MAYKLQELGQELNKIDPALRLERVEQHRLPVLKGGIVQQIVDADGHVVGYADTLNKRYFSRGAVDPGSHAPSVKELSTGLSVYMFFRRNGWETYSN